MVVLVGAKGAHENKLKEYENHLMRLPLQWGKMGTFPRPRQMFMWGRLRDRINSYIGAIYTLLDWVLYYIESSLLFEYWSASFSMKTMNKSKV